VKLTEPQEVEFPSATPYVANGRDLEAEAGEEVVLPAGTIEIPAGADVPVAKGTEAQPGSDWAKPVESGDRASPVFVYSLLIATFLGTMGLPHILVRFYTNPDGRAARRTTVRVLGLLGIFYLFPPIYGALGRVLTPELYVTGSTDAVVLELPRAAWPGLGGEILAALTAAGAFAAFMSTASGLLVSVSGTLSYDIRWRRRRRSEPPDPGGTERMRAFRNAAVAGMLIPALLALTARDVDISVLVGWAFALAASTFCPMLLLGIWWRGLTARGALAGIAAGGTIATIGIVTTLIAGSLDGVGGALLSQPAMVSVPVAFATMALVSARDRERPRQVDAQMLALHAPEELGLEALRS
jgi:Na+(H+)/acetate symporter ActP